MKKKFNDTGLCVPNKHYMVDTTYQLKETITLIEEGEYFIINRPRQFGKTTIMSQLCRFLQKKEDYLPIKMSFEGIGNTFFNDEPSFIGMFIRQIKKELLFLEIEIDEDILSYNEKSTFENLSDTITNFIKIIDKKVVLFIDEVDKTSNNELFLGFLGLLRDKYLGALDERDVSFHSVILAGLHDVKNLKLKLRDNSEAIYNSPWNIAVDYNVDMTFKPKQIETMLVDYISATSAKMNITPIAECLYFHTSGYPYFVSKICKIIDEVICSKEWSKTDIIEAIKIIIRSESNTNFDTLIKNLENNKKLYKLTEQILLGSAIVSYDSSDPIINYGKMHGIFTVNDNNKVKIFNRVYEEKIINYIVAKRESEGENLNIVQSHYLKTDGNLDIEILLTNFKNAIEEKYSKTDLFKSDEFLENDLRMLFLMFLKSIINGIGFSYKEVETSGERRLDIVVLYKNEKFIIELKLWYGEKHHQEGIEQIKDYMRREHVDKGYMIIMSKNENKKFLTTNEDGIFTAWL